MQRTIYTSNRRNTSQRNTKTTTPKHTIVKKGGLQTARKRPFDLSVKKRKNVSSTKNPDSGKETGQRKAIKSEVGSITPNKPVPNNWRDGKHLNPSMFRSPDKILFNMKKLAQKTGFGRGSPVKSPNFWKGQSPGAIRRKKDMEARAIRRLSEDFGDAPSFITDLSSDTWNYRHNCGHIQDVHGIKIQGTQQLVSFSKASYRYAETIKHVIPHEAMIFRSSSNNSVIWETQRGRTGERVDNDAGAVAETIAKICTSRPIRTSVMDGVLLYHAPDNASEFMECDIMVVEEGEPDPIPRDQTWRTKNCNHVIHYESIKDVCEIRETSITYSREKVDTDGAKQGRLDKLLADTDKKFITLWARCKNDTVFFRVRIYKVTRRGLYSVRDNKFLPYVKPMTDLETEADLRSKLLASIAATRKAADAVEENARNMREKAEHKLRQAALTSLAVRKTETAILNF